MQQPRDCFGDWVELKVLGAGVHGTVYLVSKRRACSEITRVESRRDEVAEYALKVVSKQEAELATLMAGAGIAPAVYDTVPCNNNKVGLVVQRMKGDLESLYPFSPDVCSGIVQQAIELVCQTVEVYGISHGDVRLPNLLWDGTAEQPRVLLSDWGVAFRVRPRVDKQEILYSSLNMLYTSYTETGGLNPYSYWDSEQEAVDKIGLWAQWRLCWLTSLLHSSCSDAYYSIEAKHEQDSVESRRERSRLDTARLSSLLDSLDAGDYSLSKIISGGDIMYRVDTWITSPSTSQRLLST